MFLKVLSQFRKFLGLKSISRAKKVLRTKKWFLGLKSLKKTVIRSKKSKKIVDKGTFVRYIKKRI